jgi:hypothetical protein
MSAYQTAARKANIKPDRIDRALALIECGMVQSLGQGRYHVQSKRQPAGYVCTANSCTCFDYMQGRAILCKHIWAGPGAHIARYIGRARRADTIGALIEIANEAKLDPALSVTVTPRVFTVAARREFINCRTVIQTTASAPAKPWPGYDQWAASLEAEQAKREGVASHE